MDPGARIWPFKPMLGRQAFDTQPSVLLHTHAYWRETDTAFWVCFDQAKATRAAADDLGTDYSGEFDFVYAKIYWPATHMVAPVEQVRIETVAMPALKITGFKTIDLKAGQKAISQPKNRGAWAADTTLDLPLRARRQAAIDRRRHP